MTATPLETSKVKSFRFNPHAEPFVPSCHYWHYSGATPDVTRDTRDTQDVTRDTRRDTRDVSETLDGR